MSHLNPQSDEGARPLKNPRQEQFCQAVLETNSLKRAYESIGLKRPRGNAERYARQHKVAKRLSFLWAQAAQAAELNGARHLLSQERIADANIFDFFDIDPETGQLRNLNLAKVPHVMGSAVQEISYDSEGRPKLKMYDASAAQRFIIERAAPKPHKVEMTGRDGAPLQMVDLTSTSDAELAILERLFGSLAGAARHDGTDKARARAARETATS